MRGFLFAPGMGRGVGFAHYRFLGAPPMPNPPRILTYQGKSLPLTEWAPRVGLAPGTLRARIDALGYSVAVALTRPADPRFRRGGRPKADAPRPCPPVRRHRTGA